MHHDHPPRPEVDCGQDGLFRVHVHRPHEPARRVGPIGTIATSLSGNRAPTSANRVGAENSATSGDLQLLVYETTEAIPTGGSAAAVLCAVPQRHVYARLPADGQR